MDIVKEMIEKEQFEAPKFTIDKSVRDFYDFNKDSFKLADYRYNDFDAKIEIAI